MGNVIGVSTNIKTSFSFKNEKNMNIFSEVFNKAKEEAFQNIKDNAIVGIQSDMEIEAGSYFFTSVTGTAVKGQI